jgi:murein L,D-transpeptidase YafK
MECSGNVTMMARFWTVQRIAIIALALASAALPQRVEAGWETFLSSRPFGPPYMLAIDKQSQTFFFLTRRSPLAVSAKYTCTTGQALGDKLREGDLRTPEGVYFIQSKIEGGLNYDLYGELAYPLNFPNPVDRIKGKTGRGIWVHGRGKPFEPRETRGCVALADRDIKDLEPKLKPGTPVIIAEHLKVDQDARQDSATAKLLVKKLKQWARDWQNESNRFFTHYAPEKFTKAQGTPFEAFRKRKQRIFGANPWLQVFVDDVGVVAGPDYWVTSFDQLYRSPSLLSNGRKRLYWQQDDTGAWRIVGREFRRAGESLVPAYLSAKTKEVKALLESWRRSWKTADLDEYLSFYEPGARQGNRRGREAIADHKQSIWKDNPPEAIFIEHPTVVLHQQGLEVRFLQTYAAENGYTDKGIKTLVLEPQGNGWAISSEDWEPLS